MHKQQRLLTVLVAFLCLCLNTAWAQTGTVKGVVVDTNGETVIGASVVLKSDKTQGTITDLDGNFSLKLPSRESTLVISYVGMITQEVKATVGKTLHIVLEEDNAQLEEVIVVGYGQQKKASVVGAITQTTGKTLERAAGISNVAQALTGNLPGVITNQSDGMPGEGLAMFVEMDGEGDVACGHEVTIGQLAKVADVARADLLLRVDDDRGEVVGFGTVHLHTRQCADQDVSFVVGTEGSYEVVLEGIGVGGVVAIGNELRAIETAEAVLGGYPDGFVGTFLDLVNEAI